MRHRRHRLPPVRIALPLLAPLLLPALPAAAQEGAITLADDPFEITDSRASRPGEAEIGRDSPRFQIAFAVQWAFGPGGR